MDNKKSREKFVLYESKKHMSYLQYAFNLAQTASAEYTAVDKDFAANNILATVQGPQVLLDLGLSL